MKNFKNTIQKIFLLLFLFATTNVLAQNELNINVAENINGPSSCSIVFENDCTSPQPETPCEIWCCTNEKIIVTYNTASCDEFVHFVGPGSYDIFDGSATTLYPPFYFASIPCSTSTFNPTPLFLNELHIIYSTPGVYTWTLTEYRNDLTDCVGYMNVIIHVLDSNPITNPSVSISPSSQTVCVNEPINFSSSLDPNTHSFLWYNSYNNDDSHSESYSTDFDLAGSYYVYLSINGECNTNNNFSFKVTVVDLIAEFTYNQHDCNQFDFTPTLTCSVPSGTYSCHWEIDNPSTTANPDYQYTNTYPASLNNITLPPGTYTVTLTVTETGGSGSTYSTPPTTISVGNSLLAPVVSPNPILVCGGGATAIISSASSSNTYVWTPGANVSLTNFNASNTSCTVDLTTGTSGTVTVHYIDIHGCVSPNTIVPVYGCCDGANDNLTFNNITVSQFVSLINANGYSAYMTANSITGFASKIAFNGTLTINVDFSFIDCPQITFGPYAKVIIANGKHLTIDNSIFKACTNVMWNGITTTHPTDIITITNASQIHDALIAVSDLGNAQINCDASLMIDNYNGFLISHGVSNLNIYGSTFKTQSNLLIPHLGEKASIGIQISSSQSIEVGKPSPLAQNNFINLNFGVSSYKSSANIHNGWFQDILKNPTVTNSGRAIYSYNPGALLKFEVGWDPAGNSSLNNFYNCYDGVYIKGNHLLKVQNNIFTFMIDQGIHVEDDKKSTVLILSDNVLKDKNHTGIVTFYNYGSSIEIARNTIELYNATSGMPVMSAPYTGIICSEYSWSGSGGLPLPHYEIFSNRITQAVYGIIGYVMDGARIYANNIKMYPSVSSALHYENAGIRLGYCSNSDVAYNVVDGGNLGTITNPIPNWRFKVYGIDNMFSTYSSFYCDSVINCNWAFSSRGKCYPTTLVSNGMEFDSVGLVLYEKGFVGPQGTNAATGAYCTTYDNRWNGFGSSASYENKRYTGTYLTPDVTFSPLILRTASSLNILSPSPFAFFQEPGSAPWTPTYCQGQTHHPLKCSQANYDKMLDLFVMEKIAKDSLGENEVEAEKIWNKENLYLLLKDNPALLDSSFVLQSFFDTTSVSAYAVAGSLLDSIKNVTDTTHRSAYAAVINSLEPRNEHEQNMKMLTTILNESFGDEGLLIDSSYFEALRNIASECPMEGGPAVFLARGLYYYATDSISFEFENNCLASTGFIRKENSVEGNNDFKVQPTLIGEAKYVNVLTKHSGEFSIFDITGRMILKQQIEIGNTRIDLDKNLFSGIYFYQFVSAAEKHLGKLIIAK